MTTAIYDNAQVCDHIFEDISANKSYTVRTMRCVRCGTIKHVKPPEPPSARKVRDSSNKIDVLGITVLCAAYIYCVWKMLYQPI